MVQYSTRYSVYTLSFLILLVCFHFSESNKEPWTKDMLNFEMFYLRLTKHTVVPDNSGKAH